MSDAVERRTLQVYRWSPGQAARWQDYAVAVGPDTTVLDALVDVQRTQDSSFPGAGCAQPGPHAPARLTRRRHKRAVGRAALG